MRVKWQHVRNSHLYSNWLLQILQIRWLSPFYCDSIVNARDAVAQGLLLIINIICKPTAVRLFESAAPPATALSAKHVILRDSTWLKVDSSWRCLMGGGESARLKFYLPSAGRRDSSVRVHHFVLCRSRELSAFARFGISRFPFFSSICVWIPPRRDCCGRVPGIRSFVFVGSGE